MFSCQASNSAGLSFSFSLILLVSSLLSYERLSFAFLISASVSSVFFGCSTGFGSSFLGSSFLDFSFFLPFSASSADFIKASVIGSVIIPGLDFLGSSLGFSILGA